MSDQISNPAPGPERQLPVQLATLVSTRLETVLSEAFAQTSSMAEMDPREATLAFASRVIVVELDQHGAFSVMERFAAERPSAPCLMIGDELPAPAVRAILRLQNSDVISSSATSDEIIDAITRLNELRTEEVQPSGPCWVFTGAVGGAGATTIAIETACILARMPEAGSVCLIDLNIADGMAAAYLDGKPKLDLAGLSEAPERLDEALLKAYCWEHETGITLIAAPRDPDAHELVRKDAILRLLDVACTTFDHVLVDMPRQRLPWTKPVLSGADEVMVVSEFTVPSLRAAAEMALDTDQMRVAECPSKLVVNRMGTERRAFSVAEVEKGVGRSIDMIVRSDWKAARAAVNLGMPVGHVRAKSPLVKDVLEMIHTLQPELVPQKRRKAS
ncbi:MAG: hypothetical protein V3V03_04190 [Hyphomonadaceae bacterium]